MDYKEQQQFLCFSRIWGGAAVLVLFAAVAICFEVTLARPRSVSGLFWLLALALAGFLYYTPDYLHLSILQEKRARWAMKIRWRLIGAAVLIGMAMASTTRGRVMVLCVTAVWCATNWMARQLPKQRVSTFLWICEFLLVSFLLLRFSLDLLLGTVLLGAVVHLAIVTFSKQAWLFSFVVTGLACLTALLSAWERSARPFVALAMALLVTAAGLGTHLLVRRAQRQSARNVGAAMEELIAFSGYSSERIRQLWETSDRQLAENWKLAAIPEHDSEKLAQWYRDNSELYLFALSAYNLEYKRIRSNLNVLKLGRGRCLDYGAGNGEILLELARRGHSATYYDVEGLTARFALHRAQRRGLKLTFFHSKSALAATAQEHGFDTIFSLDVLEHLPDLRGELDFLSSMLTPGGLLVFDVPAGATKSHPMHLNHDLNVLSYLRSKGLEDARSLRQRLPFRKEEKFFFRAVQRSPATIVEATGQNV